MGAVVTNPCFDASTNGMVRRYHSPLPTPRGGEGWGGTTPYSPLPGAGRPRGALGALGGLGLGGQWRWRNEGTIESKRELVVAVEVGKYNNGKKRFESAR